MITDYQRTNRERYHQTGGRVGMPIILHDGSTFWSRGWRGCEIGCGGDNRNDAALEWFEERRGGWIRCGWRCKL